MEKLMLLPIEFYGYFIFIRPFGIPFNCAIPNYNEHKAVVGEDVMGVEIWIGLVLDILITHIYIYILKNI